MKRMIKEMTAKEYAEYRHKAYMKHRNKRRQYQKEYYQEHCEEIKKAMNERYRTKILGE